MRDAFECPAMEIIQVEDAREVCGKNIRSPSRCCGSAACRHLSDDVIVDEKTLEPASASKKLKRALVVCSFVMLLEIVGGSLAGSLAILSDATHLVCDVAGFAISLLALRGTQWTATPQHTYGYLRLEVLGALVSVQSIWIMTGYIIYEAVQRIYLRRHLVDGRLMCFIATVGVAANIVIIFLLGHGHDHGAGACEGHSHFSFHHHEPRKDDVEDGQFLNHKQNHVLNKEEQMNHLDSGCHHGGEENSTMVKAFKNSRSGEKPLAAEDEEMVSFVPRSTSPTSDFELCHKEVNICSAAPAQCSNEEKYNINLRGAYLHALGDLIQSVGVMITGIVIWIKPEWQFIDLLCSFLFSIVVLSTTFRMIKDVLSILMESTPRDVDVEALNKGLLAIPGVVAVHKLHVWALTTGTNVLTCHLHIKPVAGAEAKDILQNAKRFCTNDQKMKLVTIQIEDTSSPDFHQLNS